MNETPQVRSALTATAVTFYVLSFHATLGAADDFRKLSGAQVQHTFAGMEFTDQVHWAERYGANGTLTTREMGTTRVGKWRVEDDAIKLAKGLRMGLDKMTNIKNSL